MFQLATYFSALKTLRAIFCLAFLWLMVDLLFYNRFTFNYESYLNQQYSLVFWLPILAMILIWLYKNSWSFNYRLGIGHLLIAIASCFLCFSDYYSFGNEYFFTVSIIAAACYCFFLLNNIGLLNGIITAFMVLFIVQLYLGMVQQFSLEENNSLAITGTLQNSGVYAYYLVFNLPFFYWLCFSSGKRIFNKENLPFAFFIFKIVFTLVFTIVFYLICCTQSRTAFICLTVTIGCFLWSTYKKELRALAETSPKTVKWTIGVIGIVTLIGTGMWLLSFKKLSAMGRLLGLDITWQHISDHFWLGTGLGRFTWYYPQWQAAYFDSSPKPIPSFLFSASESYIIFNEHLQLFTTIGLLGSLPCVYGLLRFFKLKAVENAGMLRAAKCTVIAILCSGITSYPLHVNIILLLLGTSLAIGFAIGAKKVIHRLKSQWAYMHRTLIILCFVLVCCTFYKGYLAHNAAVKWASLRNKGVHETLAGYKRIYAKLDKDGKFLIEYGTALLADSSQIPTAISTLERAKQLLITRQGIEAMTTAYVKVAKYDAAIANQRFLVNYLPSIFLPKYNLLELYVLKKDTVGILQMGKTILQMPIKIQSYKVAQIKQNTRKILKNYL